MTLNGMMVYLKQYIFMNKDFSEVNKGQQKKFQTVII